MKESKSEIKKMVCFGKHGKHFTIYGNQLMDKQALQILILSCCFIFMPITIDRTCNLLCTAFFFHSSKLVAELIKAIYLVTVNFTATI